MYHKSTVFGGADGEPSEKYHAVNITSIVKPGDPWPRLELRAIPMQSNPEELMLMTKLFTARIEFLKKKTSKIAYTASGKTASDAKGQVEEFFRYVTESGLDWGVYSKLMLKYNPNLRAGFDAFAKMPQARRYQCRMVFQ